MPSEARPGSDVAPANFTRLPLADPGSERGGLFRGAARWTRQRAVHPRRPRVQYKSPLLQSLHINPRLRHESQRTEFVHGYRARRFARVCSLWHSLAAPLLEAGYDVRTVQDLLGDRGVSTTMVYTQLLIGAGRGVRSPADRLGSDWVQEWRIELLWVKLNRGEWRGMAVHLLVRQTTRRSDAV